MDISPTVPRRGDWMVYAHPEFWKGSKINNLRDFYGVCPVSEQADRQQGYSPFRTGLGADGGRPWMGMREGNDISPASSECSATVRPQSSALTSLTYPDTVATSHPRAHPQTPVHVVRHVHVNEDTITEERIAMQKLRSENENLRRMCGELQRVVDDTVQKVQDVSEDAKHVALMARQLADMQLQEGELPGHDGFEDSLSEGERDEVGSAARDAAGAEQGQGQRLNLHADVLRIEDTPAASKRRDLILRQARPGVDDQIGRRLPPQNAVVEAPTPRSMLRTPRDEIPIETPRSGLRTPRDGIRPGTASFSPRPMIHPRLGSKAQTPRQATGATQWNADAPGSGLPPTPVGGRCRPDTGQSRPRASNSATGVGMQTDSRPLTAQSTQSEKLKRQVLQLLCGAASASYSEPPFTLAVARMCLLHAQSHI